MNSTGDIHDPMVTLIVADCVGEPCFTPCSSVIYQTQMYRRQVLDFETGLDLAWIDWK